MTGPQELSLQMWKSSVAILALLSLRLAGVLSAQAPPAELWREAPPTSTGPEVGQAIPPFSIADQTGRPRDFKSIAGPNGAMIVFQRSVDW